jgi:hypothetical protein
VRHAEDVEASGQLRARLQETEGQLVVMRAERDALQVSHQTASACLPVHVLPTWCTCMRAVRPAVSLRDIIGGARGHSC